MSRLELPAGGGVHALREPCMRARMKTVLVVEDTDDLREMFTCVLEAEGYEVLGAPNGKEALDVLGSLPRPPNLVLLDLMMPVMDGPTFIANLENSQRLGQFPVVVISAASNHRVLGAERQVRKPIEPAALVRLVRDFCGAPNATD
jgi:CheY-like chemotaxis protein